MFHLLIKTKTKIKCFFREITFSFCKCFSKFYGNLASFFFDNEKRMNINEKIQNTRSGNSPGVLFFPFWLALSTGRVAFIAMTSKVFKNPIDKTFICGSNINTKIKLTPQYGISFSLPKHYTSFSVNNACQVGQFFPMVHGAYNV